MNCGGYFVALGCGEFVCGAGYSVTGAVRLLGVYFVVVGGAGFQAVYSDAENCLCVTLIHADVGFCGLGQLGGVFAIVYDAEMFVGAAGVIAGPANDHFVGLRKFDLGALTDLDVRARLSSRGESAGRRPDLR